MAYDDLKRIAGVRVGATPLLLSKKPAPASSPQVIPSPKTAIKLAFGRAGARDLRTAVLSPTRAAPMANVAATVLAGSTAGAAIGSAAGGFGGLGAALGAGGGASQGGLGGLGAAIGSSISAPAAPPPAPAPAPMPASVAAFPPNLVNLAVSAGAIERALAAPPPAPRVDEPAPILANLPAGLPAGIQAIVDHHDAPALPPPPAPPLLPAGPMGQVLAKAIGAAAERRIPGAAGSAPSTFTPVSRAAAPPSRAARGASLFSGPASRGYSDVLRAQSAAQKTTNTTTKGRSIMASRYQGTGEVTYCPINSDGVINAGTSSTLPGVRAQKPFQPQELLIDPDTGKTFDITDIKIGNEPVGVTAGSVSAQNFPPSNGPKFSWKVADGVDIIFSVANTGTLSVAFTAMLVGEVVTPVG